MIRREFKAKPPWRMPTNPKPVLEAFQCPIFRVHHTKLAAYIQQVFGFEFDFLIAMGVTEGQCVELAVDGKIPDGPWTQKAADLRIGRRSKSVQLILGVLAHDGYIQAGKYIISTHPLPDPTQIYTHLLERTANPDDVECVAFRQKHRGDKVFSERAAILDERVREFLK